MAHTGFELGTSKKMLLMTETAYCKSPCAARNWSTSCTANDLGFIIAKRGLGGKVGNAVKATEYGLTFLPWENADDAANDWASEKCEAPGRQLAAEQTLKHRKNPIGEANLNVVRLERARRKLGRGHR